MVANHRFLSCGQAGPFHDDSRWHIQKPVCAQPKEVISLEKVFGCQLIERVGRRKIRLTLPGEKLFQYAVSMLDQEKHLIAELNERKALNKKGFKTPESSKFVQLISFWTRFTPG